MQKAALNVSNYSIVAIAHAELTNKRNPISNLSQITVFTVSELINEFYFGKRELIVLEEKKLNRTLQNYVFSSLFQVFANSIIYDDLSLVVKSLIDTNVTYAIRMAEETILE